MIRDFDTISINPVLQIPSKTPLNICSEWSVFKQRLLILKLSDECEKNDCKSRLDDPLFKIKIQTCRCHIQ